MKIIRWLLVRNERGEDLGMQKTFLGLPIGAIFNANQYRGRGPSMIDGIRRYRNRKIYGVIGDDLCSGDVVTIKNGVVRSVYSDQC